MNSPQTQDLYKVLSIELEPTHYKTDLWNCIAKSDRIEELVIYTQRKNWAPDGGHNYLKFPKQNHRNRVLSGEGVIGSLCSSTLVMRAIMTASSDMVLICGYSSVPTFSALLLCFLFKKRFCLVVDEFNNQAPKGSLSVIKRIVRESLRWFCFKFSSAVLVCGENGKKSALLAGCAENKINDYPYVVDVERILKDQPSTLPEGCSKDLAEEMKIIFFSGRMIQRKGLSTLIEALSSLNNTQTDWVLWVEGDGPELSSYKIMANEYGIADKVRFLGFCQYDQHSWLIRNSDTVVVPSLEDNWGIVVDEGLQLKKFVISSDATGSGQDRIINGQNGFTFKSGDVNGLQQLIERSLTHGKVEQNGEYKNITPTHNLNMLTELIEGAAAK